MMQLALRLALRFRTQVLALAFVLVSLGIWALLHQRVDAYPDISSQMVQIVTVYPGRAPEEVERQVTIPMETAMRNVPQVETLRSRTIFGLSVVQLIFEEGTESYWARQRVQERLSAVALPESASAELGALATAYGEVFRYELAREGPQDLVDLRTLNDWVVIPRLLRAPGVAEVSNFGGLAKEYAVIFEPEQLRRHDVSIAEVVEALQANNASAGGSVIRRGSMAFVVRGRGSLQGLSDLEGIFIKNVGGTPVLLKDVATVQVDHRAPSGIFSRNQVDSGVEGIVLMRRGENTTRVLEEVQRAVAELNEGGLPAGVRLQPFYDRTFLVRSTLYTVTHSVLLGVTFVILALLFFLGRPAMALLVAATIPFALLVALLLMHVTHIPIGLLSVGAIDFGIVVDGTVIMAESIARRVAALRGERPPEALLRAVLDAAAEVERPLLLSVILIVAAYLPLLTLGSIEGLLFRPMALTMIFTLCGALLFALFLVPTLATFVFRDGYAEWENPLVERLRRGYGRVLAVLLRYRWQVATATLGLFVLCVGFVVPRLGTEFLPPMDEGVIWVRANFPEGTSLEQSAAFGKRLRSLALELEDVDFISVQAGRNDSGTDPFPPSRLEIMVGPKPAERRHQFASKQALVAELGRRFRTEFPSTRFNFTQPIIDSVTEDTNGTSANLAVELSGEDPRALQALAERTRAMLRSIAGATDVSIEQEGPQPQVVIEPDRTLCARYNVRIEDVTRMIDVGLGGQPVGALYEGDRRFDITARFWREHLDSPEALGRLPVHTREGVAIPLAQVARIEVVDGQTLIARENGRRRLTLRTDIVGRDQGGFVAEAQARFATEIPLPSGYRVGWLGMFENLARAKRHFAVLFPLTLGLILVVLVWAFRSARTALVLLMPIPFAFMGATTALYVRGMNLNVSTGVGFATLFAVALLDGLLMVSAIHPLRMTGVPLDEAIIQGRLQGFRPILMASVIPILGLVPASLATGLGSDVQRPLATVIIWGLSASTLLTHLASPVFYRLLAPPLAGHASDVLPTTEPLAPLTGSATP
ncbi:CusA/CzcA family heavy metal efflux RND transporter [Corallococcus sp. H22C18031201]|nr:CusA/CzcA family heavy metal efflux RND transporter [Corallococcus sp. H22C18031201]